jgi:hypothetical protein
VLDLSCAVLLEVLFISKTKRIEDSRSRALSEDSNVFATKDSRLRGEVHLEGRAGGAAGRGEGRGANEGSDEGKSTEHVKREINLIQTNCDVETGGISVGDINIYEYKIYILLN